MSDAGAISLHEGAIIAGKYRLVKPIARGGMGSVWVARHIELDEPVAIKLIAVAPEDVADAKVRLLREAKSAARLRSPHVVQLLDYGVDREVPYLVTELLEGEHLAARIRKKGRLSLADAGVIAEQVGKALRRAHKAGIVHRDLTPSNVFLAKIDDEEIVKLLDFGIAKAVRGTLIGDPTHSNVLIGSPHYMSPEQSFASKEIDHRTDLWSLGVILFEAITGQRPFQGGSIVNIIMNIRSGPAPVASQIAPDLPPEVDAFFRRALERDPARRFASARAMVDELSSLVKDLGPRAKHVGPISTEALSKLSLVELSTGEIEALVTMITGTKAQPLSAANPSLTPAANPSSTPAANPPSTPAANPPSTPAANPPSMPAANPPSMPVKSPSTPALNLYSMLALNPTSTPPAPPVSAGPPPPDTRVARLIDQGFAALRAGDKEAARKFWVEARQLEPSNRALELNLKKLEKKREP